VEVLPPNLISIGALIGVKRLGAKIKPMPAWTQWRSPSGEAIGHNALPAWAFSACRQRGNVYGNEQPKTAIAHFVIVITDPNRTSIEDGLQ